MSAREGVRGTLAEGALAPLVGGLQRARASGWLRFTVMEVRAGIPSVTRFGLRLRGGRVTATEADLGRSPLARPLAPAAGDTAAQAAAILAQVLSHRDGVVVWEPEAEPAGGEATESPAAPWLGAVVLRAVDAMTDPGAVHSALGESERRLIPSSTVDADVTPISPAQAFLLSRVGDTLTAAELCRRAPDPEAAEKDVLGLLSAGLVDWAPPAPAAQAPTPRRRAESATPVAARPAAAPSPSPAASAALRREVEEAHAALRRANPFEVLGLGPEASDADVRQAFARLARRYHPDAQRDPALADLRPQLVDLFVAISDAQAALKDPATRQRHARSLGARGAAGAPSRAASSAPAGPSAADEPIEARIWRAEEALGAGQPWEAIRLLEEAVPAATGENKARAQVVLGRAYADRERPREAEKVLLAVLQADPRSVPACLALGRLYRDRGMVKRARGMFERVLEVEPRQAEARRELLALPTDPPEPPAGGSLLSRLRGERH